MKRQPTAVLRAALVLSLAWTLFSFWRPATFVLTSFGSWPPVVPLFAFLVPSATVWVLLAAGVIAAGYWLTTRLDRFSRTAFIALAFTFSAALSLSVHAVRLGTLPGAELMLFKGEEILEDARAAKSVSALLHTYTDRQATLSLHGRTKPPGFAVMYRAMLAVLPNSLALLGTMLTLIASLLVLPVYFLAHQLDGDEKRARAAALVAAAAPPAVMFGAVSLDAVFGTVAAGAFALTAWELANPSAARRVAIGLAIFIMLMLSYSGFVAGLLCVGWLALERIRQPRAFARTVLDIAVAAAASFLVLALVTGFNAWTCFANAVHLNSELMTGVIRKPIHSFAVWSYASVGNPLAFAIVLGPALVGPLALLRRSDLTGRARTLAWAASAMFALACFGGTYLMETERILLFFLPIIAALVVRPVELELRSMVTLSAVTALAFELALFTFW
jgi:hypothetical protein